MLYMFSRDYTWKTYDLARRIETFNYINSSKPTTCVVNLHAEANTKCF